MSQPAWWESVIGDDAVVVTLHARDSDRRRLAGEVRALPAGTRVAICDASPLSALRCQWFANRAGLKVHRRYALLPGPRGPGFAVELTPEATGYFWRDLFAVPGGPHPLLAVSAALTSLLRTRPGSALFRAAVPGRLICGVRV